MKKYVTYIEPMGAVRMTQAGKWKSKTAMKYLSYKTAIGYSFKTDAPEPTDAVCGVKIKFFMPIPPSWTKKDRANALHQPHSKKPDIDNLIKGVFDAANGILWRDDNQVARCEAEKVYDSVPRIEIEVTEFF